MIDLHTPGLFNQHGGAREPDPPPRPQRPTGVAAKAIHRHSRMAHDLFPASKRAQAVLGAIERTGPATDRQICSACGYSDMNAVRPTITRLVEDGVLRETGSVKCPITNRTVRVVAIITPPTRTPRTI